MSQFKIMLTRVLFVLGCIAVLFLGLYLAFNKDWVILGSACTLIGGAPLWLFIKNAGNADVVATESTVDCSYNKYTKMLYVKEKSPEFRKLLSIRAHNVNAYQYVQPSYVYTGATVGGITTGGVHKQGDYYKNSTYNTNCELVYLPDNSVIERIGLTEELNKAALNSSVSSFMDGGSIRVVDEVVPSQEFTQYMSMGLTDLGLSQQERDKAAAYPTREKCEKIINWLCQEGFENKKQLSQDKISSTKNQKKNTNNSKVKSSDNPPKRTKQSSKKTDDRKTCDGINPKGEEAVYLRPLPDREGFGKCPKCGTEQKLDRHICWHCETPFMYDKKDL